MDQLHFVAANNKGTFISARMSPESFNMSCRLTLETTIVIVIRVAKNMAPPDNLHANQDRRRNHSKELYTKDCTPKTVTDLAFS